MGTEHRTLHNRVLAVLGPAIAGGEYTSGHTFTLQGLEQDFGVSRTVAREAVRVLESMRLVVSRPRTGVRVRPREDRSEEHTSELQSRFELVCRLLLEKKKAMSDIGGRVITELHKEDVLQIV